MAERPRHPTQPPGKLVPATVEIDDQGNPVFSYPEATPQKMSPQIVTPRTILSRLSIKRGSSLQHNVKKNGSNGNSANPLGSPVKEEQIVSLHESLLEESFDEDDENRSVKSKGSLSDSVKSLGVRLGLRRSRKHKDKRDTYKPLSPLKVLVERHEQRERPKSIKIHRLQTDTSVTSCSSRTNSLTDMGEDEPSAFHHPTSNENEWLQQKMAPAPLVVKPIKPTPAVPPVPLEELHAAPPAIATLQALAPELSPAPSGTSRGLSEPNSTSSHSKNSAATSQNYDRRRASMSSVVQQPKQKNKLAEIQAKTIGPRISVSVDEQSITSTRSRQPSSARSSASSTSVSSHSQNPSFKIFVLLLHPKEKIFELIQLFFNPSTTTIRDVLGMVPSNATESLLGGQTYTGLCRPNSESQEEEEISDLDLLVQNHDNMKNSAQIVRGEILVAIPLNYTAKKVASLSQQILVNPRIRRLLESSDPMAKAKKKSNRKERHRKSHHGSSSRRHAEALNRHAAMLAEDDNGTMLVQIAMQKAASAAAAANAAILELPRHEGKSLVAAHGRTYRYPHGRGGGGTDHSNMSMSLSLQSAIKSLDSSTGTGDYSIAADSDASYSRESQSSRSIDCSDCSMDQSYSTWSKSLDTSFAGATLNPSKPDTPVSSLTINTSMALMNTTLGSMNTTMHSVVRTPKRRNKQLKLIRRITVGIVVLMCLIYFADTRGFASRDKRIETLVLQPLGLTGFLQFTCIFLVLVKLQFLCTMTPIQHTSCLKKTSKCPFMRARASVLAANSQQNLQVTYCDST
jgi:hypothetical protein